MYIGVNLRVFGGPLLSHLIKMVLSTVNTDIIIILLAITTALKKKLYTKKD